MPVDASPYQLLARPQGIAGMDPSGIVGLVQGMNNVEQFNANRMVGQAYQQSTDPNGNTNPNAAMNLLRLAAMLNDEAQGRRALRTIEAFRPQWSGTPHAMPAMLGAIALALEPPQQVVLAGEPDRAVFRALAAVLQERLGPRRVVLAIGDEKDRAWLASRAPWLAEMKPLGGRATAYVCEHFSCQAPVSEPGELRRLLE